MAEDGTTEDGASRGRHGAGAALPAEGDLGRAVRLGLRWSLSTQLALRLVSFLAGIAVFRLLDPADFGVYALALAVLNIALCVNDLGQELAILGWGDDVDDVAGSATTLAVAGSLVTFAACWVVAPAVAASAGQPQAAGVIRLTASLLVLDGIVTVPRALLFRTLRQRNVSVTELVAAPVNFGLAVVLAATWPGPWGPAIGTVAGGVVNAAFMLHFAPRIPRPRARRRQLRRLLAVGMPGAGTMTVEMGLLNVDSLIIAHQLGARSLGFYALAFNVSSWPRMIITTAVRKVSIAALNRLIQAGEDWRGAFTRSLSLLAVLLVPICLLLGALAEPLVEFLYSAKSLPAAPVLTWLVVLGGLRVCLGFVLDLLVAHGRTAVTFRTEVLWLLAAVPALWVGGAVGGIRGVAIGHVLAATAVAAPVFLYEATRVGAELRPVAASLVRPALGAAAGAVVAALLTEQIGPPLLQLVLAGGATVVVYGAIGVPRTDLAALGRRARRLRGRRRPSVEAAGTPVGLAEPAEDAAEESTRTPLR